jgi:hypothetical protein
MTPERIENPFRSPPVDVDGPGGPAPALPLRAMTGYEEEVVERRRARPNTAALCNEIVARCAVAPGADFSHALALVRAMPVARRDLALLALRRMSLGDVVASQVICPACGATSEVAVDLAALPLPAARDPAPVRVTLADGAEATLHPVTAGDQEALLEGEADTRAARRTALLSRALRRLGERAGPFTPADVWALPIGDRAALDAALEGASPALDLRVETACATCAAPVSAPLDVASFFLPK